MMTIEPGRAHVWRFDLDSPGPEDCLSDDERERAGRLPPLEGARFAAARSALRLLLSRYTSLEPEALEFTYSPEGKPSLRGHSLCFSISHSGGLMVAAVARDPIGIDVEEIREINHARILRDFFPKAEAGRILSLPAPEQAGAFFRLWTEREALAKGSGRKLHEVLADASLRSGWRITPIGLGPFVAAVAAREGTVLEIMGGPAHEILLNQRSEPYRHGPQ